MGGRWSFGASSLRHGSICWGEGLEGCSLREKASVEDVREEGGFAAVGIAEEEDANGWWVVHCERLWRPGILGLMHCELCLGRLECNLLSVGCTDD